MAARPGRGAAAAGSTVYKGEPEAAIERFKIALDLAPYDSLAFNSLIGIGCAHFYAGRYREAAHWQERALIEHPSAVWVHRTMCPAYVLAGAAPEARRSLATLREHYPDLTIAEVQQGLPPLPESYRDRMFGRPCAASACRREIRPATSGG